MPEITIDSLKKLWSNDKDSYRTAEVGSGVQKFVKKVFQCPELYNLKEGKLSTDDLKRKNEILEEAPLPRDCIAWFDFTIHKFITLRHES